MSVANEISQGDGISTSEASRPVPGLGQRHVDPATTFRWITAGILRADGSRIKLEAIKVGGRFLTSRQAVQRFLTASNEMTTDASDTPATPEAITTTTKASALAAAKLEGMGA